MKVKQQEVSHFSPFCDYSYGKQDDWWIVGQEQLPSYSPEADIYSADICNIVEHTLDKYDSQLRELSLQIHGITFFCFWLNLYHSLSTEITARSPGNDVRGKVKSPAVIFSNS